MASLQKSQTVTDIVNAIKAINPEIASHAGSEAKMIQYWTAIIGALYDRITSDLEVQLNGAGLVPAGSLIAPSGGGAVTGVTNVTNLVSKVV